MVDFESNCTMHANRVNYVVDIYYMSYEYSLICSSRDREFLTLQVAQIRMCRKGTVNWGRKGPYFGYALVIPMTQVQGS